MFAVEAQPPRRGEIGLVDDVVPICALERSPAS